MTERAMRLKTAVVNQAQGLARPATQTAMRAALGVVVVLAVAAALWYAKTAIFLVLPASCWQSCCMARRARYRG
jgi:hypothetical protein